MRKATMSVLAALALFGGALTSQEANAGQTSPVPVQEQSLTDASGFGQALSAENLGGQSGGSQTTQIDELNAFFNSATANAAQSDNNITGSTVTGLNEISDGAFAKMNGFATVIQNTGNQVLIENQLIVNVVAN
jgi:hypothetical protein